MKDSIITGGTVEKENKMMNVKLFVVQGSMLVGCIKDISPLLMIIKPVRQAVPVKTPQGETGLALVPVFGGADKVEIYYPRNVVMSDAEPTLRSKFIESVTGLTVPPSTIIPPYGSGPKS